MDPKYVLPLFFLLFFSCAVSLKPKKKILTDELGIGLKKDYTINAGIEFLVSIANLTHDLADSPPRVSVECLNCYKSHPAFIIFKQERGVTSIELPMRKGVENNETFYNKSERTLCPFNKFQFMTDSQTKSKLLHFNYEEDVNESLDISLSTSSPENVTVSLFLMIVKDFVLELDKSRTITLTPFSPAFYYYGFSNHPDELSVVVKVESEVNNCMVLSIQNVTCPISNIEAKCYVGLYQTVSTLGALTVTRSSFPLGFFAVFSLYADDSSCLSENVKESNTNKTIAFSVLKTLSSTLFLYIMLGTFTTLFIFFVVMNLLVYFCIVRSNVEVPELEDYSTEAKCVPSTSTPIKEDTEEGKASSRLLSPINSDILSIKTDSSLDETDVDLLTDLEQDKNIFRTKVTLCVSDLAKKNPNVLEKKSKLYFWSLITVFLFYVMPSCQLVLTYQESIHLFGNTDLCYYNFLCSYQLGYFFDFNHFFSNIGYVFLGVLFIIITHRKESTHNRIMCQNDRLDRDYGVPQHFGLFYAMGTSLIFEGFLSACYHICPNIYNFQFDVSFMYVISTLCMVKIYQSRHPDVNATAYSTFLLMGLVLFLNLLGIFNKSEVFMGITFFVVHIGIVTYISIQIYYVGRFSISLRAVVRYFKEFSLRSCKNPAFWRPVYPIRFWMLALINMCNWIVAVYGFLTPKESFSNYLLIVFISNLMLYTAFYIIMKVISKERILPQAQLFIFLAFFTWVAALYFFFNKTVTWKKTPAESRTYNKPCQLLEFYDNHDIWHFLSSAGLFFSFLVLLILDDDLIFVNRCKIPVF